MRENGTAFEAAEPRLDFGHVAQTVLRKLPRVILVTAILCGLAYAVLLFVPKLYQSSANLLVEPRANVYTTSAIEQGATQFLVDDAQIASQIELIRSRTIMLAVIDQLGLRELPEFAGGGGLLSFLSGPADPSSLDERVINTLRDRTSVTRERDSRLLTIAVRSEDPELAAEIANAIAQAHVESRTRQQLTDTATATQWLQAEIERLRASVAAAEGQVADFRVANDLFVGPNNTAISDQQLSTVSSQIAAAAERRGAAQSRADMIDAMLANGESVLGLPDVQSSPIIQSLSQELARLQSTRAERLATLLPGHPEIRALDGQIATLSSQIATEAGRVAAAFQSQAQIEADLEASLRADLQQATTVAGAATRQGVTLAELEREASAQRELLNAYLLRYTDAASRTQQGSALPDVRLVSEAAPSSRAAFPQTMLILVAVALVSIVFQIAAIIFSELLSGRAVRLAPAAHPIAAAPVQVDAMPFSPLDGTPAAPVLPDAPLPSAEIAAVAEQEAPGWGVQPQPEVVPVGPVIPATVVAAVADPEPVPAPEPVAEAAFIAEPEPVAEPEPLREPEPEEPTMFSITLSRVIAASGAVIAAMPHGYGVYSPQYLGHGYPVVAAPESEESFEPVLPVAMADTAIAPEHEAVAEVQAAEVMDEPPQALRADTKPPVPRDHLDVEIERVATAMLDGGNRVVVVTATGTWQESALVAERLGDRLLAAGLSVVEIDAASGAAGTELGLSDLSAGDADFGDVVHRSAHQNFSTVQWGQGHSIDRRSERLPTLVEALADIHEVVLVVTGRIGLASLLGAFTGIGADCLLVAGEGGITAAALEDLSELGFADLHVVTLSAAQSDVA